MLARIQECILYRGFSNGEILNDMTELINLYEADEEALKAKEDRNKIHDRFRMDRAYAADDRCGQLRCI